MTVRRQVPFREAPRQTLARRCARSRARVYEFVPVAVDNLPLALLPSVDVRDAEAMRLDRSTGN